MHGCVALLCRTAGENKFGKPVVLCSGWVHMHKQLRLKQLKNNQMGSIFHLLICFIERDEYETPGYSKSEHRQHSSLSVSNDPSMIFRFLTLAERNALTENLELNSTHKVLFCSSFCQKTEPQISHVSFTNHGNMGKIFQRK